MVWCRTTCFEAPYTSSSMSLTSQCHVLVSLYPGIVLYCAICKVSLITELRHCQWQCHSFVDAACSKFSCVCWPTSRDQQLLQLQPGSIHHALVPVLLLAERSVNWTLIWELSTHKPALCNVAVSTPINYSECCGCCSRRRYAPLGYYMHDMHTQGSKHNPRP